MRHSEHLGCWFLYGFGYVDVCEGSLVSCTSSHTSDDGLFVLVVADRHSETLCCAIRLNGTVFASPVVYASGLKPEMKVGFRIVSF